MSCLLPSSSALNYAVVVITTMHNLSFTLSNLKLNQNFFLILASAAGSEFSACVSLFCLFLFCFPKVSKSLPMCARSWIKKLRSFNSALVVVVIRNKQQQASYFQTKSIYCGFVIPIGNHRIKQLHFLSIPSYYLPEVFIVIV